MLYAGIFCCCFGFVFCFFGFLFFFGFFETGFLCGFGASPGTSSSLVDQADLELTDISLPLPPKC